MNTNNHPPAALPCLLWRARSIGEYPHRRDTPGRFASASVAISSEWFAVHQAQLQENWNRAEAELPLLSIEPL
jgi:hypothetical protein